MHGQAVQKLHLGPSVHKGHSQRGRGCLNLRFTILPEKPPPTSSSYTVASSRPRAGFSWRVRGAFHQLAALPAQTSRSAGLCQLRVMTYRASVMRIYPVTLLMSARGCMPWNRLIQNAALGRRFSPKLFCTNARILSLRLQLPGGSTRARQSRCFCLTLKHLIGSVPRTRTAFRARWCSSFTSNSTERCRIREASRRYDLPQLALFMSRAPIYRTLLI